ncbi:MAG: hypothetical protein U9N85_10780 [Bacteroidota bacterium]|nr:hypothetical protein [Bacteroidota bacterium]
MKHFLSVLTVLLFTSGLFAQSQVIYNRTSKENYVIKFQTNEQTISNKMMQELAKGNSGNHLNMRVRYSLDQTRKILKRRNILSLLTTLSNVEVTGNNKYKDFVVSEFVLPSKVSFDVAVKNRNSTIREFSISNAPVSIDVSEILNETMTDSLNSNQYRLELSNKYFSYTSNDLKKFKAYIGNIETYYTKRRILKNIKRELNSITVTKEHLERIEDIRTLRNYNQLAAENINSINTIRKSPFISTLDLRHNDPANFMSLLEQSASKSKKLKHLTSNILNNLDEFYYNKGLDRIAINRHSEAKLFFEKSIRENNKFAPSHVQLAKILYNTGYRKEAVDKIYLVTRMNPDAQTQALNDELADNIYKDLILEASDLNSHAAFDDAIHVLHIAEQLCRDFTAVRCLPNMDAELLRAIKGKYYIITDKAYRAMQSGGLDDSENLIDIAINYRRDHLTFIPEHDEIIELTGELYNKYINSAISHNNRKQFSEAVYKLNEAQRVCRKYKEVNCDSRLDDEYNRAYTGIYNNNIRSAQSAYNSGNYSLADKELSEAIELRKKYNLNASSIESSLVLKIKNALYKDYVATGKTSMQRAKYEQALERFNLAKEIERNYKVTANRKLSEYITNSAEGLTLDYIDRGKNNVSRNHLKSARSDYNKAKSVAANYNILNIPVVKSSITELKNAIFKQECMNAQNKFDNYLATAEMKISSSEYMEADKVLNTAVAHANSNSACEIDLAEARKMQNEISDAVDYLAVIEKCFKDLRYRKYNNAIVLYEKAGERYQSNNVSRFGIIHIGLYDFITGQSTDFINYGVYHFTKEHKLEKALLLLKTLNAKEYRRRNTNDNQKFLGGELARRDYAQNPNGDRRDNINRYTKGDRYFVKMKRAYRRQWRKLD